MRISYIPNPPPADHALASTDANRALVSAIAARRRAAGHPEGLVELDRALLHSAPVAGGWNAFLGAVRTQTAAVAADVREAVVCRVASCNRAQYEWGHHVPLLKRALADAQEGPLGALGDEERLAAVERVVRVVKGVEALDALDALPAGAEWVAKIKAVVRYVDAMTKEVVVPQGTWDDFRAVCASEREVVEITSICAAYNCVSRFLVALDVGEARWED